MPAQNDMKTYQAIVVGIIIGFLGGVGTMQATIVGDVKTHETRLTHIEADAKQQVLAFEQRMDKLVRMMESLLQTNRELIARWDARQNGSRP